jgi:hypothetical protein
MRALCLTLGTKPETGPGIRLHDDHWVVLDNDQWRVLLKASSRQRSYGPVQIRGGARKDCIWRTPSIASILAQVKSVKLEATFRAKMKR